MKKIWMTIAILLACSYIVGGCATSTCKKICDCIDDDEDDCVDDCKDKYSDGDHDCREALRDLGDCLDDDGCGSTSCIGEAIDVVDDCGFEILL